VFNTITIVWEGGAPPRFRLSEEGSPPRVASVAVLDVELEQPIWWVVPVSFTDLLPFTVEETSPEDLNALADEEPIDPIEDLPQSDPRHQAAIPARDVANERAFPVLETLAYGVVPSGFRQASPNGEVTALIPGRAYSIAVMGPGGHGQVAFRG